MDWKNVKCQEDLEKYLDQMCYVTPAHSIRTCGQTCCTPNDKELYQFTKPKPLSLRKSFMLFLADFKARLSQ